MKTKTLLAIGDSSPNGMLVSSSFERFIARRKLFLKRSLRVGALSYSSLLKKSLPSIESDFITAMFFFPYNYWNQKIERHPLDKEIIYGDETFGKKFNRFFELVEKRLKEKYKDKKLTYVNPPRAVRIDRDKKLTKDLLKKHGIPTPRSYQVRSTDDIMNLLNRGISLYLKPRFGAMGKGITYLSKEEWYTNFLFRRKSIVSRPFDYGWDFMDITGRLDFLKELLKSNILCEEAVKTPMIKKRKFDLRIYVIYGETPYIYAKSIPYRNIVTNWSQGGRIERKAFLKKIPKKRMEVAKKYAVRTARALGLNFAGVDLIFSRDYKNIYVLEAHSFPGYEKGFDLHKFLINRL